MASSGRLKIVLGIPVRVKYDDCVRRRQIDAHTTSYSMDDSTRASTYYATF